MKIGILSKGLILSIELLEDNVSDILSFNFSSCTNSYKSWVFNIILFSFLSFSVVIEFFTEVIIVSKRPSWILL